MKPYYSQNGITIFHGDSRDFVSMTKTASLILTDPPYGYGWDTDYSRFPKGGKKKRPLENDKKNELDLNFLFDAKTEKIVFGFNSLAKWVKEPGSVIVWDKRDETGFSFLSDGEIAFWSKGRGVHIFNKNGQQARAEHGLHPTQKPVGLFRWCIEKTNPDGFIFDPFMGSGTTLRAAKDLGKKAVGIEIDERFCEIAAERLRQDVLF